MNTPLISIVIATKNRVDYCIQTVNTLLEYPEDFELVIQDNTDSLELKAFAELNFTDKRIKYNYTPPPFSSIDNFNAALELATGQYVCLLGDDDGVLENFFEVVKWAAEQDIDSVCPRHFINYLWPNESSTGRMIMPNATNQIWYNRPLENIQALVDDGIVLYTKFNLPKLYHGLVKKSCLDQVKAKTGYYLGGLSPDIYSAVALSAVVKKHVVLDFPITIAGACPKSTTVDNTKGTHSGSLENAPHFRNRAAYDWKKIVPRYYSVQTIWSESGLQAIDDLGIAVDVNRLNIVKILAGAINDNPGYKDLFLTETKVSLGVEKTSFAFNMAVMFSRITQKTENILFRVKARIPLFKQIKAVRIYDVADINACTKLCNKQLDSLNFEEILKHSKIKYKNI